jgi:hypothetical protein
LSPDFFGFPEEHRRRPKALVSAVPSRLVHSHRDRRLAVIASAGADGFYPLLVSG